MNGEKTLLFEHAHKVFRQKKNRFSEENLKKLSITEKFEEIKAKKMWKFNVTVTMSLFMAVSMASASYSGPFLFWGMDNLNDLKIPTLQGKKRL